MPVLKKEAGVKKTFATEDEGLAYLEKAKLLYNAELKELVHNFAGQFDLEIQEWYHDSTSVVVSENMKNTGLFGMRRQIELRFDPEKSWLWIYVTAYQDSNPRDPAKRRLKSDLIGILPLELGKYLTYDFKLNQMHDLLRQAWGAVNTIEPGDLLSIDKWVEENTQHEWQCRV